MVTISPAFLTRSVERVRDRLKGLQAKLSFEDWQDYPQFATKEGLGRTALLAVILGVLWGTHFLLCFLLTLDILRIMPFYIGKWLGMARMFLLWQWTAYFTAVCTFHLLEFFITAIYHPETVSADSFLINHSTGYTAAALTSWTEFLLRAVFFPKRQTKFIVMLGLVLVIISQILRSLAMITAGASFHHLIQTSKKDNHVLITHGIYSILRHPSYVGFFYWSIGLQLVLGNLFHAAVLGIVSWNFFQRRIHFEEETLCQLFPSQYQDYVRRTWMGIPFLNSKITAKKKKM